MSDALRENEITGDVGPEGSHPDGVRAVCKDCEIVALFDTEIKAGDAVDSHDNTVHGGVDTAGIVTWDLEPLPGVSDIPLEVLVSAFAPEDTPP